jgi:hypothetical protein
MPESGLEERGHDMYKYIQQQLSVFVISIRRNTTIERGGRGRVWNRKNSWGVVHFAVKRV